MVRIVLSMPARQIKCIQQLLCVSVFLTVGAFVSPVLAGSAMSEAPIHSLSNSQLISRAEAIRSTEMSMEQRALNHQWLSAQQKGKAVLGGKALSQLGKRIFNTYAEDLGKQYLGSLGKNYIAPSQHSSANTKGLDYNFRLSSKRLNIGVEYQF